MTISEFTLMSSDPEPVRRFEVFTGCGRRREWLPEKKARIVADSYESGETVSAVARRYALSPQQLFATPAAVTAELDHDRNNALDIGDQICLRISCGESGLHDHHGELLVGTNGRVPLGPILERWSRGRADAVL